MSNDSSTGGYLVPASSPAPLEDDLLDNFIHDIISGVTGLPGNVILPRWQPEPVNLPAVGTDWMAFGIVKTTPDTFAVEYHHSAGNGTDELIRHEVMDILVSSYGPNSRKNLQLLSDGLQIAQNREVLFLNSMAFVETTDTLTAPQFVKDKWLRRIDFTLRIRRQILRSYPVLNLLSANGLLYANISTGNTTIDSINTQG